MQEELYIPTHTDGIQTSQRQGDTEKLDPGCKEKTDFSLDKARNDRKWNRNDQKSSDTAWFIPITPDAGMVSNEAKLTY
jgi:hypothetical protein